MRSTLRVRIFVADEAKKIWQAQGLRNSLVITTSANAAVAKQGSFAYDTSKAAANHLVRELAIELVAIGASERAGACDRRGRKQYVPARPCDFSSLTKYNITFDESESTEAFREQTGAILCPTDFDEVADHAGRPG